MHNGLNWIFIEDPLLDCAYVQGAARLEVCFLANVASATFTGNAIDALCRLLRISVRPSFHK
jgi:hypothetical protein